MIVYEVTLDVEASIAGEYLDWLRLHIGEMLALPGFVDASLAEVLEPSREARRQWCVTYRLHDRAALDAYLAGPAAAMRADGLRRFGGRFEASRRILLPDASQR